MSTTFRIDYVEAALLTLLNTSLATAYGAPVNIDSLGEDDFDAEGQLVLQPPSVRVRFVADSYNNFHDSRRLTYQSEPAFEILCFESSLRSKADERKQTLVLVASVINQLAGARLNLEDGSKSMPITINDVRLVETEQGPVDQLFSVRVTVEGIAQFSGVNAQLP
jgi:hypothetical protein